MYSYAKRECRNNVDISDHVALEQSSCPSRLSLARTCLVVASIPSLVTLCFRCTHFLLLGPRLQPIFVLRFRLVHRIHPLDFLSSPSQVICTTVLQDLSCCDLQ